MSSKLAPHKPAIGAGTTSLTKEPMNTVGRSAFPCSLHEGAPRPAAFSSGSHHAMRFHSDVSTMKGKSTHALHAQFNCSHAHFPPDDDALALADVIVRSVDELTVGLVDAA